MAKALSTFVICLGAVGNDSHLSQAAPAATA